MSLRVQPGPPGSLGMSHYGIGGTSPPHASASPPAPGFGGGYQQPYTYNQPYQPQMQQYNQQPQQGYAPGQPLQFAPQQPYGQQYGAPQQQYQPQLQQQQPPQQSYQPQQPVMIRPAPQQPIYPGPASIPSPTAPPAPIASPPSSGPAGAPRQAFVDPALSPPKPPVKHISGATVLATWAHPSLIKDEGSTHVIQSDTKLMARLKVLEELAPDTKLTRFILNTLALLVDMFKLFMASMLAVFVPQLCPPSEAATGGPSNCTTLTVPHDCTFSENFHCLSRFNQYVLSWNFLCLAALLIHYRLVWQREAFMIENFKETLTQGRLHLKNIIAEYPTLQIKLHKYNRAVFNTSVIVVLLQIVNVITSGYLTMVQFNNGYKTYTTFFTNCILITIVLYTCLSASWVGLKHELAHSCVGIEPVSYNSIRPSLGMKGE